MGSYLIVILLIHFIRSGCQILLAPSTHKCENPKYEKSEIEFLRSVIIRFQEEKRMQDDLLNHLENRIVTLASKYKEDSRRRTNDIRMEMFQKKLDVIENKILSHDAIVDYLNKQNGKLDEKLNNTSIFTMELNDEFNDLSQEFEENKRNMKSEIANQQAKLIKMESLLQQRTDTIRNEREMQMMFLNNTVSRIRLLSDNAWMNISLLSSELKLKNASDKKLLGMYEIMNQATNELSQQLKTLNGNISSMQDELYMKHENTQKMLKQIDERADIINNSICLLEKGNDKQMIKTRDIEEKNSIINGSIMALEARIKTELNETFHVLDNFAKNIQNLQFFSDKLEKNVSQTREMVLDTTKDFHSLNLTVVSVENTISRQNEELEVKLFEFVNVTYTNSVDSLLNEVAVLQQRNRNYSSQLSAIFALESNLTKNYSSLEQSVSDCRNSIYSLRHTVSSLERNGTSRQSTINSLQTWVASQKSSYRRLVRLVNGSSSYGRLEVNIDGEGWGNVCDDHFDTGDANVVCRQLGFSRGVLRNSTFYGQGSLKIIMDDVDCSGSEHAIQNCRYIGENLEDCRHNEDVGVSCS